MPKHVAMGELGARRRIAAMAVTTMAHRPLPWFELRKWWVDEVEEVMAELWARVIERWCCSALERRVGERESESESERVGEWRAEGSPFWHGRVGQHLRTAAT